SEWVPASSSATPIASWFLGRPSFEAAQWSLPTFVPAWPCCSPPSPRMAQAPFTTLARSSGDTSRSIPGSEPLGQRLSDLNREYGVPGTEYRVRREEPVEGTVPRFAIPEWRERFGVVAGITGRGSEDGRGFDLGLWTDASVHNVMPRWCALRQPEPRLEGNERGVPGEQT